MRMHHSDAVRRRYRMALVEVHQPGENAVRGLALWAKGLALQRGHWGVQVP